MEDGRKGKMKLIRKLGTRKIVSKNRKEYTSPYGLFLCPYCGKEVEKVLAIGRKSRSCGCVRGKLSGETRIIHGDCKRGDETRLHRIWDHMKSRCYDENNPDYKNYGGRGITICNEWRNDYTSFKKWALANGYKDNLTIDRINNNGDYEPDNCKWSTHREQNRNRRDNRLIEFKEETHCLSEWAEILGIKQGNLNARISYYGWSVEKAFTTKVKTYVK